MHSTHVEVKGEIELRLNHQALSTQHAGVLGINFHEGLNFVIKICHLSVESERWWVQVPLGANARVQLWGSRGWTD